MLLVQRFALHIAACIEASAALLLALLESIVAISCHRLQVAPAEEQPLVTAMRDDVIDYICACALAIVMRTLAVGITRELATSQLPPSRCLVQAVTHDRNC